MSQLLVQAPHHSATRSGATSIYVVVVATLLFTIITVSFVRILLRDAASSAADELSQMAYDSALAGVEDAKTTMQKYRQCVRAGHTAGEPNDCGRIISAVEKSFDYASGGATDISEACDSVKRALTGNSDATGETLIQEVSSNTSTTNQAYTCVILAEDLKDYRSSLLESNPMRVIPLQPKPDDYTDLGRHEAAEKVAYIRIDWYSHDNGGGRLANSNGIFSPYSPNNVEPPVLSAQLIQTDRTFTLSEFDNSEGDTTNRALVYLTPKQNSNNKSVDVVSASTLASTNNHLNNSINTPISVSCENKDSWLTSSAPEFACSAVLEVPTPVAHPGDSTGGFRNWETFYLVLNLPYRAPDTDFAISMYAGGANCRNEAINAGDNPACLLDFSGVQVAIDSTGRANDLYSRVEARIEFTDINFPFPQYAIQATSNAENAIDKNFYVTQDCGYADRNAAGKLEWKSCYDSGAAS